MMMRLLDEREQASGRKFRGVVQNNDALQTRKLPCCFVVALLLFSVASRMKIKSVYCLYLLPLWLYVACNNVFHAISFHLRHVFCAMAIDSWEIRKSLFFISNGWYDLILYVISYAFDLYSYQMKYTCKKVFKPPPYVCALHLCLY